ncbi:unnamed protein product [Dracunculus medinensis]|uniref:Uncharacterized protein n=1 Tax=Dracunculus medinensis TaxID=318479 RepID=A0A3P7PLL0_DRAME|nr:unnamed protein product [Dracunculus medinensis]
MSILVNKCSNVLKCADKRTVILYLPNVVQLPIAILASLRIGNAVDDDAEMLAKIIIESDSVMIITIDGFWQGTVLYRTKYTVDEAVERSEKDISNILVIRHICPNKGIPEPQRNVLARRPYYPYKIFMKEGRDLHWSEEFMKANTDCIAQEITEDQIVFLQAIYDAGKVKLIKRTLQQLYDKMERLDMINLPPGLCFAVFDSDILLQMVAMINILARGHQLLIFEGIMTYPDYSRISQIINLYKVN